MHTVSVGFARSLDLDEIVEAVRIYAEGNMTDVLLKEVEGRLQGLATKELGEEWYEKGLLNILAFYDKTSDGIAI